jgi:hypothetical protein
MHMNWIKANMKDRLGMVVTSRKVLRNSPGGIQTSAPFQSKHDATIGLNEPLWGHNEVHWMCCGLGKVHTFLRNMDWMNMTVMADLPTPPEPITTNLISVGILVFQTPTNWMREVIGYESVGVSEETEAVEDLISPKGWPRPSRRNGKLTQTHSLSPLERTSDAIDVWYRKSTTLLTGNEGRRGCDGEGGTRRMRERPEWAAKETLWPRSHSLSLSPSPSLSAANKQFLDW